LSPANFKKLDITEQGEGRTF